jgi:hypothetical protein
MIKKIIIHVLIGGAIVLFGAAVQTNVNRHLGDFIMPAGFSYAVLNAVVILFKGKPVVKKPLAFVEKAVEEREKNKALDDFLKYKKLLDEGILSQEEFAVKSEELKKKIL